MDIISIIGILLRHGHQGLRSICWIWGDQFLFPWQPALKLCEMVASDWLPTLSPHRMDNLAITIANLLLTYIDNYAARISVARIKWPVIHGQCVSLVAGVRD